ncbi:MAG: peptidyl-prolyl cis-trans isomerase, partial [Bacteroidetes bacterium]|nr:peptidyl-prolyl cis-trans isomerase [Bacteroidota bacterium]
MKNILLYTLILLSTSCKFFSNRDGGNDPVARVHDKFLYRDALREMIPVGIADEDSVAMAES